MVASLPTVTSPLVARNVRSPEGSTIVGATSPVVALAPTRSTLVPVNLRRAAIPTLALKFGGGLFPASVRPPLAVTSKLVPSALAPSQALFSVDWFTFNARLPVPSKAMRPVAESAAESKPSTVSAPEPTVIELALIASAPAPRLLPGALTNLRPSGFCKVKEATFNSAVSLAPP